METGTIVLIVIAVVIVAFLGYVVKTYNGFVQARNRVKTQWAQVDVQLKRRSDLLPNLIECVKGYAKHENEAIDRITAARSKMLGAGSPAEVIEADAQLGAALSKVFALSEAYPDLKANTNFLKLQSDLGETETKIAHARQFYNDTVLLYRDKITQFPAVMFAGAFGFKEEPFFEATAAEKENIEVKF